jgi:NADH:ubiquinone oxidoreductase subunit E
MEEIKQIIIESCMGTACHILGGEDLLETIKRLPKEILNQTKVRAVTCLQHCGKGPNVRINGQILTNMTPEGLLQVIQDHWEHHGQCQEED